MQLEKAIILPKCHIEKNGLRLDDTITKTEWHDIGGILKTMEGCIQFWIGDWLRFGEKKWGEIYKEAEKQTGLDYDTLKDYKGVADDIQLGLRNPNLTYNHHRAVRGLEENKKEKMLEMAEKKDMSVSELRFAVKEYKQKENDKTTPKLGEKKYGIIYADPPWEYQAVQQMDGKITSSAEHHYPTMSLDRICALDISSISDDDCTLFIWTTSPLLEKCFPVITAWGFSYRASFVWDKVRHNVGHYNSVRHEFLLIAVKGKGTPENVKLFDSVQSIEKTDKHSEKPKEFIDIINTLYPDREKIELFSREKKQGWDSWGNQL
jgi:N6-adenosine-specific RNA methylase IME4